jgi:hypothetical protein
MGSPDTQPPGSGDQAHDALVLPSSAGPASEQLIYHGGVSLWLGWRALGGSALALLAGLALWVTGLFHPPGSWPRFFGSYLGLPLFLAGAIMLGYVYLWLRGLRYRITSRLIEREQGVFAKRVDSLDLARAKDVQLVQSLPDRLLRIGTLEVFSSDRTDPVLRLEALPRPRPIYEQLRDAVIRISRQRGVMPMDR